MQERWLRPKFFNPFTEKPRNFDCRPMFDGFFRSAPLHLWSLNRVGKLLAFVAKRPSLFGFDNVPTCVVDPSSLLHSARSKSLGVASFGKDRGCKTLVIPASMTSDPYDVLDAKLIEPLIRWNPSLETVFLHKDCQPMAGELGRWLGKSRTIKKMILPDWDDPLAIAKVVMPCKHVEVIEVAKPDEAFKDWKNEAAVGTWCELIEMHPKLGSIRGGRDYISHVYQAIQFSRCKHNIALLDFGCNWSVWWWIGWLAGVVGFWWVAGLMEHRLAKSFLREKRQQDLSWLLFVFTGIVCTVLLDFFRHPYMGRSWVYYVRYGVMLRSRLDPLLHR